MQTKTRKGGELVAWNLELSKVGVTTTMVEERHCQLKPRLNMIGMHDAPYMSGHFRRTRGCWRVVSKGSARRNQSPSPDASLQRPDAGLWAGVRFPHAYIQYNWWYARLWSLVGRDRVVWPLAYSGDIVHIVERYVQFLCPN